MKEVKALKKREKMKWFLVIWIQFLKKLLEMIIINYETNSLYENINQ